MQKEMRQLHQVLGVGRHFEQTSLALSNWNLAAQSARMAGFFIHGTLIIFLTLLTQLGGVAWAIALMFRKRWIVFPTVYALLSIAALWVAPNFGRVPISCKSGTSVHMQSAIYCALNRNYVVPALYDTLADLSAAMREQYPGTKTLILDANFPFIDGFPLLPHLSHNDGKKADIAFYYADGGMYLPGATRSPVGYFAFEDGPSDCSQHHLTLRWDLAWLQGFWHSYTLETDRLGAALAWLTKDGRVGKVFIEPHLKERVNAVHPKIRFQGCRAARHDDHIHIQL